MQGSFKSILMGYFQPDMPCTVGWALFGFFENFENCSSPTQRYVFRGPKNRFEKIFGPNAKICRPVKDLLSEFTFGM